jgi:hypothetical protein
MSNAKKSERKYKKKGRKKKCRTIKTPNDSLTERKNVENVNLYILKHLNVNHFIDMSMKKICEYIYFNNIQGGKSGSAFSPLLQCYFKEQPNFGVS